ncbi:MAG: molybdenum cofactor guanylyltransferase [Nitrospirae bacterium]|nr:molybdenum cofactor guanylyltransferase [Nitrospirota bacterium]
MIEEVTGVLLAGGQSRRMGQDKRFLTLGGVTLFDRVRGVLEALFSEVLIVLAEEAPDLHTGKGKVVYDVIPGCAAAGGLYTGLFYSMHPRIFAVACDMPLLQSELISHMSSISPLADIVTVKLGDDFQPMHSFYSKACAGYLETMLRSGTYKIQNLFDHEHLSVHVVPAQDFQPYDPGNISFLNVNTPGDLERAQHIMASSES